MSDETPPLLPIIVDDADAPNPSRALLNLSGVTALFTKSSYDIDELTLATRPTREHRTSPTTSSRLTSTPTTTNSFLCTDSSAETQRSPLLRFLIQRSSSFAPYSVSQAISNTRRQALKQIRSICNQHDRVSSIDTDVEPVASITNCLQAPSIAAAQICRSVSMPHTMNKYPQHYNQQCLLIESVEKPI